MFAHAHLYSCPYCNSSLKRQVDLVKMFADQNLLKLNVSKCEIVLFSTQPSTTFPVCEVDGSVDHACR